MLKMDLITIINYHIFISEIHLSKMKLLIHCYKCFFQHIFIKITINIPLKKETK